MYLKLLCLLLITLIILGAISVPENRVNHPSRAIGSLSQTSHSAVASNSSAVADGPTQAVAIPTVSGPPDAVEASYVVTSEEHVMVVAPSSTGPDFNITANPSVLSLTAGSLGNSTLTVMSQNGFGDNVTLSVMTNSTGLGCTLNPLLITGGSGSSTLSCRGSPGGYYNATVTGINATWTHSTSVLFQVQYFALNAPSSVVAMVNVTRSLTVTSSPLGGFTGTVFLIATTNSTRLSCSLSPMSVSTGSGNSTLSCMGTVIGNYLATIAGTNSSLTHTIGIVFVVGDFEITLRQSQVTVFEGYSTTVQFVFASDNRFSGRINLTAVVAPPTGYTGPLPTMSPSSTFVDLAGTSTATVSFTVIVGRDVPSSPFGIGVNTTFASRSKLSNVISLIIPPVIYSISFNPTPLLLTPGVPGSSTISITSEGGLNGTITFQPSYSVQGLQCNLGSPSLTLVVNGSASTPMSCTGSVGSYNITIIGSGLRPNGQTFTQSTHTLIVVASFSLSSTPKGILVNTDQLGHARVSISWSNSYNGTVSFALLPDAGLNASISPLTFTGTSGNANVTVVSAASGNYTLVVEATSGSYSQRLYLFVTVLPNAANSFDPVVLIVIAVLAMVIVAAMFLSRHRKVKKKRKSRL